MNLLTYLEQNQAALQGLGGGRIGPLESHLYVGPCDVAKWAQDNKGECSRGDKNAELAALMFGSITKDNNLVKDFRLKFQGTGGYAQPFAAAASLAEALWNCSESKPELPYLENVRLGVRALVGFGVNMSAWAWPGCRHYHTIDSVEAKDGFTKDFATKHLNDNADIKGARKVAQVRGSAPNQRQGIQAFGNIVTERSGGIVRDEIGNFSREILGRIQEFTDTHSLLCNYFKNNLTNFGGGSKAKFNYIDSVTFTTLNKYTMFEFERGKGSEVKAYIRFSVSCNADGDKWAVHHLSGTSDARVPTSGTTLAAVGINGGDATTTAKFA